ncbi:MAG TPA: shikimate dehydrogenase [Candidatus Cybelea sp.]|nr:shikimate dehydrogenase [Candidatus Cybelea sp.]
MRRVLVGLIGANIQNSLSPALHEDAFSAAGMRGHYHLMDLDRLPGRRLEDLLGAARVIGFAGVNVTYPCKEAVLALLDDVSEEARQIGAVNTVTIDARGRTTGYNTDRIGFRRGLEDTLGRIDGATVLLIGAGGAGRAVAFALFDLGAAAILIHDKETARAETLAASLRGRFGAERCAVALDPSSGLSKAAGVVNATPVGMFGFPGNPVPMDAVDPRHWVADVIYTPMETELIAAARGKGARVVTGGGMCVHQAAASFRLFTGADADLGRMRRLFADAIAAQSTNNAAQD